MDIALMGHMRRLRGTALIKINCSLIHMQSSYLVISCLMMRSTVLIKTVLSKTLVLTNAIARLTCQNAVWVSRILTG